MQPWRVDRAAVLTSPPAPPISVRVLTTGYRVGAQVWVSVRSDEGASYLGGRLRPYAGRGNDPQGEQALGPAHPPPSVALDRTPVDDIAPLGTAFVRDARLAEDPEADPLRVTLRLVWTQEGPSLAVSAGNATWAGHGQIGLRRQPPVAAARPHAVLHRWVPQGSTDRGVPLGSRSRSR